MKVLNKMIVMGVCFMTPLCLIAEQDPAVPPQTGSEPQANVAPANDAASDKAYPREQIPCDAYVVPMNRGSVQSYYSPQPCYAAPQNCGQPYYGSGQNCFDSCCNGNFSFEADWLYWQIRGFTPFGSRTVESGSLNTSGGLCENTKCLTPKAHFDSGVRLGFWYQDLCNCLNFGLIWTHMQNKVHKSIGDSNGFDNIGNSSISLFDFSGSHHTRVNLDYLDFDFSYNFETACCFTLTPHVGIRALWLDYSRGTSVTGTSNVSTITETSSKYRWKSSDDAVGLEGGLWLAWKTRCNVTLFGHFGGSLLYYTAARHERYIAFTDSELGPNARSKSHCKFQSTSPMFNYAIGLQYERCICNRNIALQASWEQVHLDFHYLQWQGLTLGLAVSF